MKNINYILIAISLLVMVSCKKDKIEIPESNEPVFRVYGTFDGDSLTLIAGDDGAYMHTMTKLENGVNIFTGINNGQVNKQNYDYLYYNFIEFLFCSSSK